MTQSLDYEAEATLADASRASVWIPWYFKRGALTVVTAPLFLLLVYCIAVSAFVAVVQGNRPSPSYLCGFRFYRCVSRVFGGLGACVPSTSALLLTHQEPAGSLV